MPDEKQAREAATNPREENVAVALAYRPESDRAPKIVASGRGAIAEQILQAAHANGIHVREDADLVQLLRVLELGSEIPVAAFAAVAEILVYIYRANGGAPTPTGETDTPLAETAPCP